MSDLVYLDHLASTPLDSRVLDAMRPWLEPAAVANPHAGSHRAGWRAAEAIEAARAEVAGLIGAEAHQIVFTSGATEANNLALFGASGEGWTVLTSAIEHPSVLDCLPALAHRGRRTAIVPVDGNGLVDLDALDRMLGDAGPCLVSAMGANNETGVIQPLGEVAHFCRAHGARLHSDAVQLLATGMLEVGAIGIDLLSLSGHKLYGPMGIGALYVAGDVRLSPLLFGGGQQVGRRPGTLPTALCVGLGAACRIAREQRADDAARLGELRERLFAGLATQAPTIRWNAPAEASLPGCLHVSLPGIDAEELLLDLPELALSTGSACASGRDGPSHVLLAMGIDAEAAHGSLRFGLGRGTTAAEIDLAVARIGAWLSAAPGGSA